MQRYLPALLPLVCFIILTSGCAGIENKQSPKNKMSITGNDNTVVYIPVGHSNSCEKFLEECFPVLNAFNQSLTNEQQVCQPNFVTEVEPVKPLPTVCFLFRQ